MTSQRKKKKNDASGRIKNPYQGIALVGIIVVLLGIGAIAVIYNWLQDPLPSDTAVYEGAEAREKIESVLKTTLPDSATNLHLYYTSWLDFVLRIRVDILADEVPVFLESLGDVCFNQPTESDVYPFVTFASDTDWWQPTQAETYLSAPQCGDDPFWHLMIDQTDDNVWIVYIEEFST